MLTVARAEESISLYYGTNPLKVQLILIIIEKEKNKGHKCGAFHHLHVISDIHLLWISGVTGTRAS